MAKLSTTTVFGQLAVQAVLRADSIDALGGTVTNVADIDGPNGNHRISFTDSNSYIEIKDQSNNRQKLATQDTYFDDASVWFTDHTNDNDAHHEKYTDSDATGAVGASTPFANSDLSNSSVTIEGNSVSLGSSTTVDHNDLSSIKSNDHHSKTNTASELTDVSADSTSDAHHSKTDSASELTDVSADSTSDAHHSKTSSASELTDVSPDSTSDAHHSKYTDTNARSAIEGGSVAHVTFSNVEDVGELEIGIDQSEGALVDWGNGTAPLLDGNNLSTTSEISLSNATGASASPTLGVNQGNIDHNNLTNSSDSDAHHSKTSSASELTDVSPDSTSSAHHSRFTADEVDSTNWGGYEIQLDGTDGTGVINFKTS